MSKPVRKMLRTTPETETKPLLLMECHLVSLVTERLLWLKEFIKSCSFSYCFSIFACYILARPAVQVHTIELIKP